MHVTKQGDLSWKVGMGNKDPCVELAFDFEETLYI